MKLSIGRAKHQAVSITHGLAYGFTRLECQCGFVVEANYSGPEISDMERAPSLIEVAALFDEHIASAP